VGRDQAKELGARGGVAAELAVQCGGDRIGAQRIKPEQPMSVFQIGRMGRPEELVAAVRYLCSDDASYVTGSMRILDGGYTAQ
jgi:NAD(P)-dependent dehydrogenase (short-subunit alcohol dehydrogenase family)